MQFMQQQSTVHVIDLIICVAQYLCVELYDMGNLVPAEAHKALIIFRAMSFHDNIRFKICLPVNIIRCGGCPPFRIVGGGMAFWPHVIPADKISRGENVFENKGTRLFH